MKQWSIDNAWGIKIANDKTSLCKFRDFPFISEDKAKEKTKKCKQW